MDEPEPNAHTLTLLFHRFLSDDEWRQVWAVVHAAPFVVELVANAVVEPPDELQRRQHEIE